MERLFEETDGDGRLAMLYGDAGIQAAIEQLEDVRRVMNSPGWANGNGMSEHAGWLLTVPPGDINFKGHLQDASPSVLAYVLVLVSGKDGHGTRAGILRSRLNALEKEGKSIDRFPTL
jgi:hypothetical protein